MFARRIRRILPPTSRLEKVIIIILATWTGLLIHYSLTPDERSDAEGDSLASLAGVALILALINRCLACRSDTRIIQNNENANNEGGNFDNHIIIQDENNEQEIDNQLAIQVANDTLIAKINELSQNQPAWDLLTEAEVENFKKTIDACQDPIQRQDYQKQLDDYLENIQCNISYEVLRSPFIPITIKGYYPQQEGQPGARNWVKTFDATQLKNFITACTIQKKLAYAPHSREDNLTAADNITFVSGFSEAVTAFVNIARPIILSTSTKLPQKKLGSKRAKYFEGRLFPNKKAEINLDAPLLSDVVYNPTQ